MPEHDEQHDRDRHHDDDGSGDIRVIERAHQDASDGVYQPPAEERVRQTVSSPIQPMNWAIASLSIGIWPSPSNSLSKLRFG